MVAKPDSTVQTMVHSLLPGARDLLPLDVAQKRWIERRLQHVFQSWGYQPIITPTLERLETLTAGGAVQPESVIQLRGSASEALGLRPELTASIARAYATRLDTEAANGPQRLYYNANVFRTVGDRQEEYYQAGVELLGGTGPIADGEILLLLADCLQQVELPDWQVVLGDAGLTSALLRAFPEKVRQKIRHCLAHLDRVRLEQLPLSESLKTLALELIDLRGKPQDVLQSAKRWTLLEGTGEFAAEVASAIARLESLVTFWESVGLPDAIVLDLSLIQVFDYYTGIVFEVASGDRVIAQGGRYDRLLGIYHPQGTTFPSIGFCINLEDLQKVLSSRLPMQSQRSDVLVSPTSPQAVGAAFQEASRLRAREKVVEVVLEYETPEILRERARRRGIREIVWVGEGTMQHEAAID